MWKRPFSAPALAAACLWLASLCSGPAWAHLMPAQQGTLNVVGDAVFAVLALPASLVPLADTDGDGRLSDAELRAHAPTVQKRVTDGMRLVNAAGTPQAETAEVVLVNLLAEPGRPHDSPQPATTAQTDPGATHFLALVKYQFRQAPTALGLEADVFGTLPDERQLTLRVSRGDLTEAAVLSPGHATHRFFRSPLQVFADYVATGVEHIVLGADHVLFLVTIIVAGAGWRYWLAVLTSFTLAHSITLTAGLLGWVKTNPAVVEPLIAASIVLMAALNLATRQHTAGSTARQTAVVFACGLLHGLGFASSMADMGLHGNYLLASLLGFNLGIELGQALCLVAVLALLHGANRLARTRGPHLHAPTAAAVAHPSRASAWASVLALGLGSYWVWERLV